VREHSPHAVWTGYPRQGDLFVEGDDDAALQAEDLLQPEDLHQDAACAQ
jgi:hypothetical protein